MSDDDEKDTWTLQLDTQPVVPIDEKMQKTLNEIYTLVTTAWDLYGELPLDWRHTRCGVLLFEYLDRVTDASDFRGSFEPPQPKRARKRKAKRKLVSGKKGSS